ncbi:FAD-dependent oxidoreductase [Pararobbsia silviterrae]|uniref:FAD-dependent oxidoreductase n=1 Tax=Pararobbsia silviterrae TaxID=1792498 RepID=A0A494Y2Q4_9BURK|nr:FAD-dependent oxidoreductase [Pararobbsia silviterrae]RKP54747.1 FAD-dependent oxidoreductase [Pararobbsia silviterrae]
MDVIVIGGGLTGVTTAYQLRAAGHRVCVIERHATVAQEASFGQGGLVLPTPLDVWFGPGLGFGMRQMLFGSRNGMIYQPGLSASARGFVRQLNLARDPERFAMQCGRLRPLVDLSRRTLAEMEARHAMDFEQRDGVLHLFRTPRELKQAAPALALLAQFDYPHQILDGETCRTIEPSVPPGEALAGGVFFPYERSANCPLFAKQIKTLLDEHDVEFALGRSAESIRVEAGRVVVELASRTDETSGARGGVESIAGDALVLAAGANTQTLLGQVGIRVPLYPARVHALTAPIGYEEHAPHVTVVDYESRVTISRLHNRMRFASAPLLQGRGKTARPTPPKLRRRAIDTLGQAGHTWVPGAAKLSAMREWDGIALMSPDGLPITGATTHPRLFVNAGHGPAGWGLACGTAKIVADLVSGRASDVDSDSLAALSPTRFQHG